MKFSSGSNYRVTLLKECSHSFFFLTWEIKPKLSQGICTNCSKQVSEMPGKSSISTSFCKESCCQQSHSKCVQSWETFIQSRWWLCFASLLHLSSPELQCSVEMALSSDEHLIKGLTWLMKKTPASVKFPSRKSPSLAAVGKEHEHPFVKSPQDLGGKGTSPGYIFFPFFWLSRFL